MDRRAAQVNQVIRIQNIYHMLAYAFRVLREQGYRDMATEEFANTAELCAAILARGVSLQLKRGLGREYVDHAEMLSSLRGKIEVSESVKTRSVLRRQMICTYDEFSVDTCMNRVLKATMALLLRSNIGKARKRELRQLLVYFSDVGAIDLASVDWHMRFNRNNQTYRMLMNMCWLVSKGLLQTQADGASQLMDFFDDQCMSRLYEKFILEYYRREHPELDVGAPYIGWALDDGCDDMLPTMKSDVVLSRDGTVLIIDAKYCSHTMQQQYGKRSIHSHNLYQIFAYVKNKEACLADMPHEVSGMVLYAGTDEDLQPHNVYRMSGNQISVRTLDLGLPFEDIRNQLDEMVDEHFPKARLVKDKGHCMYENLTKHLPELDKAYEPVMHEIYHAVYAFMDEHPEFGLAHYYDILEENGLKWDYEVMEQADVSKLDGQVVMALLLGIIRADRFCDGALLDFFENGCIKRWIMRLQEIDGVL